MFLNIFCILLFKKIFSLAEISNMSLSHWTPPCDVSNLDLTVLWLCFPAAAMHQFNELCGSSSGVLMVAAQPKTRAEHPHFFACLTATACVHETTQTAHPPLPGTWPPANVVSPSLLHESLTAASSETNFLSSHLCSKWHGLAAESKFWPRAQLDTSCYFRQRKEQSYTTHIGITEATPVVTTYEMCVWHHTNERLCFCARKKRINWNTLNAFSDFRLSKRGQYAIWLYWVSSYLIVWRGWIKRVLLFFSSNTHICICSWYFYTDILTKDNRSI